MVNALYRWQILLPLAVLAWAALAGAIYRERYAPVGRTFLPFLLSTLPLLALSYAAVYRDERASLAGWAAVPILLLVASNLRPSRVLPDEWLPDCDDSEKEIREKVRRRAGAVIVVLALTSCVVAAVVIFSSDAWLYR